MLNKKQRSLLIGIILLIVCYIFSGCNSATESKLDVAESDLVDVEKPMFTADGIRALSVVKQGKEIFAISYNPKEYKSDFDYWEISVPYKGLTCTDTEVMYGLFGIIAGMDFTNTVSLDKDTVTGIADTDTTLSLEFVQPDGAKENGIADADKNATILIGNKDQDGNYYVAIRGYENQVYEVKQNIIDSVLSINPFDYILKISSLINNESITDIEIAIGKENHILAKNGDIYSFDKKEIEKKEFVILFQDIQFVIIDSELESEIEQTDERKAILSIVYNRDTKEAPKITTSYYVLDETYCSVNINGMERFKVMKEDAEKLIKEIKRGQTP